MLTAFLQLPFKSVCLDRQRLYVALNKIKIFVLCIFCVSQGAEFTVLELCCKILKNVS